MNLKKLSALLIALCILFLCACSRQPEETVPTTQPTTAPTTAPATEPTEPVRTAELHSGIREDGSFDKGTLFIGDSLTNALVYECLIPYKYIGDARYMALVGAPVHVYFDGPALSRELTGIYSGEFAGLTFSQSIEIYGQDITAVYFMLGTNYSAYTTYETYDSIVSHLLEHCPNATIYLQTVPFSTSENVQYGLVNEILEEIYAQYGEAADSRVLLVDTFSAIEGRLRPDGIHVNHDGQKAWYQALLDFAEENNIPQ